jgi:hypothetical protein
MELLLIMMQSLLGVIKRRKKAPLPPARPSFQPKGGLLGMYVSVRPKR